MNKVLTVKMPDDSIWGIPVMIIALHRATNFAHKFNNSIEDSLENDTLPLFYQDSYEIEDWATNNMDWDEVKAHALKIKDAPEPDWQEGWLNGDKTIINQEA